MERRLSSLRASRVWALLAIVVFEAGRGCGRDGLELAGERTRCRASDAALPGNGLETFVQAGQVVACAVEALVRAERLPLVCWEACGEETSAIARNGQLGVSPSAKKSERFV